MNDQNQNQNDNQLSPDVFSNFITVEDAAEILGVSAISGYVQRLCRSGLLKATRFGTSWAIDRQSAVDFAEIKNRK